MSSIVDILEAVVSMMKKRIIETARCLKQKCDRHVFISFLLLLPKMELLRLELCYPKNHFNDNLYDSHIIYKK